ncbi:hypothetical protein ABPG75_010279 [Micractinium tetrahymenae]
MPAHGPDTSIHHLPDELLSRILRLLPQQDWLSCTALVYKRWDALVATPERLYMDIGSWSQSRPAAEGVRRLRALQPWLLKHGSRLQETVAQLQPAVGRRG